MHGNIPYMSKLMYWTYKRKLWHIGKFCYCCISCISCYVLCAIVLQGILLLWWHLYPSEYFRSRLCLLILNIAYNLIFE